MTKDLFDRKKTKSDVYAFAQELIQEILQEDSELGENLRDWIKQKWVRITSSGKIGGTCGTSKKQSNPDRCLPQAKAKSMTQSQRAATARKKKEGGSKGKQFVSNTKKGKVTTEAVVGDSVECDNCSWTWKIADGGSDLYNCHKCGHDNTPVAEGLWANINAKKKAGKESSHKNSNAYKDAKKAGENLELTKERVHLTKQQIEKIVLELLAEKKKPGKATATHRADGTKKDACAIKVDGVYGMETSAYKSMAIAACRKVGASNWNSKKKKNS